MPNVSPTEKVGTYVSPEEWNILISDPNTVRKLYEQVLVFHVCGWYTIGLYYNYVDMKFSFPINTFWNNENGALHLPSEWLMFMIRIYCRHSIFNLLNIRTLNRFQMRKRLIECTYLERWDRNFVEAFIRQILP